MLLNILKHLFKKPSEPGGVSRSIEGSGVMLPPRSVPKLDNLANFFFPAFWGVNDPAKFAKTVEELAKQIAHPHHAAGNFITWGRNNSMFDDQAFVSAWESNIESGSDRGIVWRRYVLATSAFHCIQLEGDFVECGAYTGVGVKTIVDYLGGIDFPKQFWAYDVFEHQEGMINMPMPEVSPELFDRVKQKFSDYPQVIIVRGHIPESFVNNCPQKIAYLHIDLNQAPAEVACLDSLFDRVVPGGMVILDDYEWSGIYRAQKLAEDEWFDRRGYRVIPLPTGQGLVIKR